MLSETPLISLSESATPLILLVSAAAPSSTLPVSPDKAPAINPNIVSAPSTLLPSDTVLHSLSIESHKEATVLEVSCS